MRFLARFGGMGGSRAEAAATRIGVNNVVVFTDPGMEVAVVGITEVPPETEVDPENEWEDSGVGNRVEGRVVEILERDDVVKGQMAGV